MRLEHEDAEDVDLKNYALKLKKDEAYDIISRLNRHL